MTTIIAYRLFDHEGNLRLLPQSPFDGVSAAYGLSIDLSDSFLYAADNSGNTISGFRIDRTSGALSLLSDSPYPAGTNPTSVTIINDLE
jgi:6-phosphogluconolactonase (cycloisomerase 2 family)